MRQSLFYLSGAGKFFLAHRIRISMCFTWTDDSYLMLSHPGPDKNHVYIMPGCIGSHVSTSSSDVGIYSCYVKKMTSLYAN